MNTQRIDKLRWVTLIMILFVGTTSAFLNCLSVYITPLAEKGWDPAVIVAAYTIMMIASVPGSMVGGILQGKFGNRFVLKTCGLGFIASVLAASFATNAWMYAICIGGIAPFFVYCIYAAQIANLGGLFPDRQGFATGALMVGVYIAGAAVVPIAAKLTIAMDVMPGIRVLGIVFGAFTVIVGFIMVEAPEGYMPTGWEPPTYEVLDADVAGDSAFVEDVPWKKLITLKSFWVLLIGQIFMAVYLSGFQSSFVMLSANATGCTEEKAAWMYSVFAIVMGVCGLVAGWVSDKVLGPLKITAITAIAAAVITVVFVMLGTGGTGLYMVLVVIAGLAFGTGTTLLAVILMSAYGTRYFGIHFGIISVAMVIASYIGPQFAIGDPMKFFMIAAVTMLIGAVLFLLDARVLNKELGRKIF